MVKEFEFNETWFSFSAFACDTNVSVLGSDDNAKSCDFLSSRKVVKVNVTFRAELMSRFTIITVIESAD